MAQPIDTLTWHHQHKRYRAGNKHSGSFIKHSMVVANVGVVTSSNLKNIEELFGN